MRRHAHLLFTLTFSAVALLAAQPFTGTCISVQDGDTIEVVSAGRRLKIRAEAIDCPENGQAFGISARQFTLTMVLGKQVIVIPKEHDRYGRIIG